MRRVVDRPKAGGFPPGRRGGRSRGRIRAPAGRERPVERAGFFQPPRVRGGSREARPCGGPSSQPSDLRWRSAGSPGMEVRSETSLSAVPSWAVWIAGNGSSVCPRFSERTRHAKLASRPCPGAERTQWRFGQFGSMCLDCSANLPFPERIRPLAPNEPNGGTGQSRSARLCGRRTPPFPERTQPGTLPRHGPRRRTNPMGVWAILVGATVPTPDFAFPRTNPAGDVATPRPSAPNEPNGGLGNLGRRDCADAGPRLSPNEPSRRRCNATALGAERTQWGFGRFWSSRTDCPANAPFPRANPVRRPRPPSAKRTQFPGRSVCSPERTRRSPLEGLPSSGPAGGACQWGWPPCQSLDLLRRGSVWSSRGRDRDTASSPLFKPGGRISRTRLTRVRSASRHAQAVNHESLPAAGSPAAADGHKAIPLPGSDRGGCSLAWPCGPASLSVRRLSAAARPPISPPVGPAVCRRAGRPRLP